MTEKNRNSLACDRETASNSRTFSGAMRTGHSSTICS